MTTINDSVSRVKNVLKAVKEDPFLTDRAVYSVINKYAKVLLRRQDNENKIMKYNSIFKVLPCVELIEVDKIEACCAGIKTNCTFRRTKEKLPQLLEGSFGPIFRTVSSIDLSQEVKRTQPIVFTNLTKSTTFKYNKTLYYWYLDGYLYFPNLEWEAVRIEGLFDGDISNLTCSDDCSSDGCVYMQNNAINVPEYLFAEIEQMTINEFLTTIKIPADGADDGQNILR